MAKAKTSQPILRYGSYWSHDADPLEIELSAIARMGRWEYRDRKCGNGLAFHVKAAMKLLWPDSYWHRWTELMVDEFCKGGRLAVFGPSSSQKSQTLSRAAQTIFYAFPGEPDIEQSGATVIISSTTLAGLHKRIWDYIVSGHKSAKKRYPWLPGHLIETRTMLLSDPSDAEARSYKNGIIGVAAISGSVMRGISEYVGIKNKIFILISDEAALMPPGFLDSLANLESNGIVFTAIMGNLADIHNPLGKAAEPKIGWDALPDTDKTRVYDTRWMHGRAIQLIGMDSPNLDYPEGQEPFKNLIGRRYIEQCAHNYGRESDKFHMFASGKLPRGLMDRTVFTKAMALKFHATDQVMWGHEPVTRGYGIDAAYSGLGGDRTAGAPWIFGKDVTGKWRFWLGPIKIYPGSSDAKTSHAEAIALECKRECEAHGVPPEHVFFDGTGRSELTSAFARLWSSRIVPIEFGGIATERPSFNGEKWLEGDKAGEVKLCCEVFDRFVTELWFAIRHGMMADQIRGLTMELIEEGCQRQWEIVRGAKYKVEPKDGTRDGESYGMKSRGLPSPDLCDALAVSLEGARRLGFPLGKLEPENKKRVVRWMEDAYEEQWERLKESELVSI